MDEARWVGTEPPSGEFLESRSRFVGYLAKRYADAVLAAAPARVRPPLLDDYQTARDELVTWEGISEHMWRDGARDGRFAGWLVRDGELVGS